MRQDARSYIVLMVLVELSDICLYQFCKTVQLNVGVVCITEGGNLTSKRRNMPPKSVTFNRRPPTRCLQLSSVGSRRHVPRVWEMCPKRRKQLRSCQVQRVFRTSCFFVFFLSLQSLSIDQRTSEESKTREWVGIVKDARPLVFGPQLRAEVRNVFFCFVWREDYQVGVNNRAARRRSVCEDGIDRTRVLIRE